MGSCTRRCVECTYVTVEKNSLNNSLQLKTQQETRSFYERWTRSHRSSIELCRWPWFSLNNSTQSPLLLRFGFPTSSLKQLKLRWPSPESILRWQTISQLVMVTWSTAEKEPISFCVHLDNSWQKLTNFFTYMRPKESTCRSISYNSIYFILARVGNFAAIVTLNILCLPVK